MAEQALYRRWRSQTFAEVVGQEHVTTTLRNAVASGRVAHAYLFYGPRGTGKTSTGRILAKALNCMQSSSGEPCNACPQCMAIKEGRSLDLVEIDAASNRGIDDIRDLREKVNYAPSEGRFRVYIIDEAHMLTTEAANALLKTLEEPPPHTKFILATTEVHRILPTILSRCQQFQFRPLSQAAVRDRLAFVCHEEGIAIEDVALERLARVANGSLRDAQNIVDQLRAHFGDVLTLTQLESMLGRTEDERAVFLAEQVLAGNIAAALETINAIAWEGGDLRQFARNLLAVFRTIMMCKAGARIALDISPETQAKAAALAKTVSMDRLLAIIKGFAQADLRGDEESILQLELAAVEGALTDPIAGASPAAVTERAERADRDTRPAIQRHAAAEPQKETSLPPEEPMDQAGIGCIQPEIQLPVQGRTAEQLTIDWSTIVQGLRHSNKNVQALLRSCEPVGIEDNTVILGFYHTYHKEKIEDPRNRRVVEDTLSKVLGKPYEVRCVLTSRDAKSKVKAARNDPVVRTALEMGGRIAEEPH